MLFIPLVALAFANASSAQNTDMPDEIGQALGVYRLNVDPDTVAGLTNFDSFVLEKFAGQDIDAPRPGTKLRITGKFMTTEGAFPFAVAKLGIAKSGEVETVEFKTIVINGVCFEFQGRFLELWVEETQRGSHTTMRGKFLKNNRGKWIKTPDLPLTEYGEM